MVQFTAIRTRRISAEIVGQIKVLMEQGHLRVGDRLPPERELASQLGVGRPAVREALSALEMIGLVEIQPGQGVFVARPPEQEGARRVELSLRDQVSPLDLLEARRVIETQIVDLAVARATQEDIDRLNRLVADMRYRLDKDGRFSLEVDREFHVALSAAAQNPVLAGVAESLCGMMAQNLWRAMAEKNLLLPGRAERYVREHERIARAVQDKDGFAARQEMFSHLSGVIDDLYSESAAGDGAPAGDLARWPGERRPG